MARERTRVANGLFTRRTASGDVYEARIKVNGSSLRRKLEATTLDEALVERTRLLSALGASENERPRGLAAALWRRVAFRGDDECWPWMGAITSRGYGHLGIPGSGRVIRAHRAAYEFRHGVIPAGHVIHHVCGSKTCCNPAHLVALTPEQHDGHHTQQVGES